MPLSDDALDSLCQHERLLADCPASPCPAVRQALATERTMGGNSAEAWQEDMLDDPLMDGMGEELRQLHGEDGRA